MTPGSWGEEQLRWVGQQYPGDGFPAAVDREGARQHVRRICQRLGDRLMQEWEIKHAGQKPPLAPP